MNVILFLIELCGILFITACQPYRPYIEDFPAPPPARLNQVHIPSRECTEVCVEIARIQTLPQLLDQQAALRRIAERPRLSLHEQLYLIEAALPLEGFGLIDVFTPLARQPYLRVSARNALLYYTNRLGAAEREPLDQILEANRGVPDELTIWEQLWVTDFSLDPYTILELHRKGFAERDILILLYLYKTVPPPQPLIREADWNVDLLRKLRGSGKTQKLWYQIILEDLRFNPAGLFESLPPAAQVPEPFRHPYELYWLGLDKFTPLTDDEIGLVIKLKEVTGYYHLEIPAAMERVLNNTLPVRKEIPPIK